MKTNLDLYLSFHKAALDFKGVEGAHKLHSAALGRFNEEGQDEDDWEYWWNEFQRIYNHLRGLSTQKARSETVAVAKAAKAKAEELKAEQEKAQAEAEAKTKARLEEIAARRAKQAAEKAQAQETPKDADLKADEAAAGGSV
jgi:hypothetical protein